MNKVTLIFKTMGLLWQFKQAIKANEVEINFNECTITCNCGEEEIVMATERYDAVLKGEKKPQTKA